jgi:hypothetical protein
MDKPISEAVYGVGQWKKEDVGSEEKTNCFIFHLTWSN